MMDVIPNPDEMAWSSALGNMEIAGQAARKSGDDFIDIAEKSGLSSEEAAFWRDNNPEYLDNRIIDNQVLSSVGIDGYTARQMQKPDARAALGDDAPILAEIEAGIDDGGLFPVATALGQCDAVCVLQTVGDLLSKATAAPIDATARLAGQDGLTREQWFGQVKDGIQEAVDEVMAGGFMEAFTRLAGAPRAVRNQHRAHKFNQHFNTATDLVGKTELFKAGQYDVVADHLSMTAKDHGSSGMVFTTPQELQQSGLKKHDIIKQLNVSEKDLNFANDNRLPLPVDYGKAVVFSKRQADAGNGDVQNLFRPDPDAMSGKEIAALQAEVKNVLDKAEDNFKALHDPETSGAPERITMFQTALRVGGFDANEADATSSLYWARAQQAGELWGESTEQWLDRQDVQIEMMDKLRIDTTALKQYQDMVDAYRAKQDAAAAERQQAGVGETAGEQNLAANENALGEKWSQGQKSGATFATREAVSGVASGDLDVKPTDDSRVVKRQHLVDELFQMAVDEGGDGVQRRPEGLDASDSLRQDGAEARTPEDSVANARTQNLVPLEALSPDEASIVEKAEAAPLVKIDPTIIIDENKQPIDFRNTGALKRWVVERYKGMEVVISHDGSLQRFREEGLRASLKKRGQKQRGMYAQLDTLLKNAINDKEAYESADARHPTLEGQEVYYSAALIGEKVYGIRFKIDIHANKTTPSYKDHKILTEIDIAPFLKNESIEAGATRQDEGVTYDNRKVAPTLNRGITVTGKSPQVEGATKTPEMTPSLYRTDSGTQSYTQTEGATTAPDAESPSIGRTSPGTWRHAKIEDAAKQPENPETASPLFRMESDVGNHTQQRDAATAPDPDSSSPNRNDSDVESAKKGESVNTGDATSSNFLYRDSSETGLAPQHEEHISKVSIPVLRGDVKPTRIEDGTLYKINKDGTPRGSINFQQDGQGPTVIRLFQDADVSTVVHELNHLFVHDLSKLVEQGRGGAQAKADLDALTRFAGGNLDHDGYEKIAAAWEQYLVDGEAPSEELNDAFATFRDYISQVYGYVVQEQGPPASPEVRAVFDRFLAADRKIAEAKSMEGGNDLWFDHVADMDNDTKQQLRALTDQRQEARRRSFDRSHSGKALSQFGPENREHIEARVQDLQANTPVYQAMTQASALGGFNRADVEAVLGRTGAEEIARRHGDSVVSVNGQGDIAAMQALADTLGYDDAGQMLYEMSEAPDARTLVKSELARELDLDDDDLRIREDGEGGAAALEELDATEEWLAAQVEASAAAAGETHAVQTVQFAREHMRAEAEQHIGDKPLRQAVDVRHFQKAQRDANLAALHAAKSGDMQAVTQNLASELNLHLTMREAMRARDLRQRMEDNYSGENLLATLEAGPQQPRIGDDCAEAIKALATFAGLTDSPELQPLDPESEAIPFPHYDPGSNLAHFLPDIAKAAEPWLVNKQRPDGYLDWRDFSVNQVQEIERVMQALVKQGQGRLDALADLGANTVDELVEKSVTPMQAQDGRREAGGDEDAPDRRALNLLEKYDVPVGIPENWFAEMDGGTTAQGGEPGVNQRLFSRLRDAEVEKEALRNNLLTAMQPHLDQLEAARGNLEAQFGGAQFAVPGLPTPEILRRGRNLSAWNADTLLAVALNMGSDAGLNRLTDAFGFTEADLSRIAGLFDVKTWQAVQGIWDATGSLGDQADAVTARLTNRQPAKIAARPLTVRTADGEVVSLAGGAFPLVNDPLLADAGHGLAGGTDTEATIHAGVMADIHGNRGEPAPQLLQTDVLMRHVDAATQYIAQAEVVKEFDALTRRDDWRQAYAEKFGDSRYQAIRRWIDDLAGSERPADSLGSFVMEKTRPLALRSNRKQPSLVQAANAMGDDGAKWLLAGIREMGAAGNARGGYADKIDFVNSMSAAMAARQNRPPTDDTLQNGIAVWMQANGQIQTYAVWLGAYKQALAKDAGFDSDKAVAYADSVTAKMSATTPDPAEIQQNPGLMRFIAAFAPDPAFGETVAPAMAWVNAVASMHASENEPGNQRVAQLLYYAAAAKALSARSRIMGT